MCRVLEIQKRRLSRKPRELNKEQDQVFPIPSSPNGRHLLPCPQKCKQVLKQCTENETVVKITSMAVPPGIKNYFLIQKEVEWSWGFKWRRQGLNQLGLHGFQSPAPTRKIRRQVPACNPSLETIKTWDSTGKPFCLHVTHQWRQ